MCVCAHISFIRLPVSEHVSRFRVLALVCNVAVHTRVQITPRDPDFISFGNVLRSGVVLSLVF